MTEPEKRAIIKAVGEMEPVFGCDFICYGNQEWSVGKYKSADQIMASAPHNKYGQANGNVLLSKMQETMNEWSEPGVLVLFTGEDLMLEGVNWCFGVARTHARVTVQSTIRYRSLTRAQADACIGRTLRHELGHIFECAMDLRRPNTVEKLGPHCTNEGCSMRQTMTLNELVDVTRTEKSSKCFCAQCMADMERFKKRIEMAESKPRPVIYGRLKRGDAASAVLVEPYGRRRRAV